jgi:hypothetical protein
MLKFADGEFALAPFSSLMTEQSCAARSHPSQPPMRGLGRRLGRQRLFATVGSFIAALNVTEVTQARCSALTPLSSWASLRPIRTIGDPNPRIVVAKRDQVVHALLVHVGARRRWASSWRCCAMLWN